MKIHRHIHHHSKRNPILAVFAVASAAALIVLLATNGATILAQARSIFLELESGSRMNVTQKSDTTASNGKYIQFSNGSDSTPAPDPDPDPIPTPSGGYPNASNTGLSNPGAINKTYNGKVVLEDGDTLENAEIFGGLIKIRGNNVTIRNVYLQVSSGTASGILVDGDYSGIVIEDVDIDGDHKGPEDFGSVGVNGKGFTLRRAYIHGQQSGIRPKGNNVIEDNYVHNSWNNDISHGTGASIHGAQNIVFRHNTLTFDAVRGGSSALSIYGDVGPNDNILIENNLFYAKAAYCFKGGWSDGKPYGHDISNIRFHDNRFSTQFFPDCGRSGPVSNWNATAPGNSWCNNRWHETNVLVKPENRCLR